jgi:hypothetical protein
MSKVLGRLFAAAALITFASAANAQETGLSGMHDQRVEGGRVCMSDHFHYGSSSGQRSRRAAETAAMQSWADFTVLEYGSPWGSARTAASRGMKCSQSGSGWSCDFEARPCRLGGAVRAVRRPRKR